MSKRMTYDEVKYFIEIESNSGCELLSKEYLGVDKNLKLKCPCGEEFYSALSNFRRNKHKKCNKCIAESLRKYSLEDVKVILYNNNFTMINEAEYKNASSTFTYKCLVCGNTARTNINAIIEGRRCGKCFGNKNYTHKEFVDKINIKYGDEYIILDKYKRMIDYIIVQRTICGHIFSISPHNLLNHDRGCPICKESHGEKRIRRFLDKYNIKYIRQYKFDDCKNKRCLPFDFAIFNNDNILFLVEYDGLQHERPYDRFGGEKAFIQIKLHDKIKNDYCDDNNIILIRISHSKRHSTEKILINQLLNLGLDVNIVA